jgi:hypothetical protein
VIRLEIKTVFLVLWFSFIAFTKGKLKQHAKKTQHFFDDIFTKKKKEAETFYDFSQVEPIPTYNFYDYPIFEVFTSLTT